MYYLGGGPTRSLPLDKIPVIQSVLPGLASLLYLSQGNKGLYGSPIPSSRIPQPTYRQGDTPQYLIRLSGPTGVSLEADGNC
jgi:hypothetical protein